MRLISPALVFIVLVVMAAPAVAQEWSDSFDAKSFPKEVTESRVVVVPASTGEIARAASSALRTTLEEAGAPDVIDGSGTVGDVTKSDDEEIVSSATALPIDVVVIVRSFGEGEGSQVVVTMYKKSGQAIGGFSAKKGQKIVFEETERDAKLGVSSDTVEATQSAIGSLKVAEEERATEEEEPARRWEVTAGAEQTSVYDHAEEKEYTGRDLWTLLGDDALSDYESNVSTREAWSWTGVAVMLTGFAGLATGTALTIEAANRTYPDDDPIFDECNALSNDRAQQNCRVEVTDETVQPDIDTGLIIGGVGAGVGIVGIIVYAVANGMNVEPMTVPEVDRRLNEETGMLPTRYRIGPADSGGARLSFGWTF